MSIWLLILTIYNASGAIKHALSEKVHEKIMTNYKMNSNVSENVISPDGLR